MSYLSDRIFTFFAWVFFGISMQLGLFLFLDLLFTSIAFIFSGAFDSILQKGIEKSITASTGFLSEDIWRLNTGLKGLDLIINWFIGLQYNIVSRWIMFAVCLGISIALLFLGEVSQLKFIDKSSNPKTPQDVSLVGAISVLTAMILVAPIYMGALTALLLILFEFIEFFKFT